MRGWPHWRRKLLGIDRCVCLWLDVLTYTYSHTHTHTSPLYPFEYYIPAYWIASAGAFIYIGYQYFFEDKEGQDRDKLH